MATIEWAVRLSREREWSNSPCQDSLQGLIFLEGKKVKKKKKNKLQNAEDPY